MASVALPLPSSPHWAPTSTIAGMRSAFRDSRVGHDASAGGRWRLRARRLADGADAANISPPARSHEHGGRYGERRGGRRGRGGAARGGQRCGSSRTGSPDGPRARCSRPASRASSSSSPAATGRCTPRSRHSSGSTGWSPTTRSGCCPWAPATTWPAAWGSRSTPPRRRRTVLGGRPRVLDLLVDDDGNPVVNVVHAGIGAEAARDAETWKQRIGPARLRGGSGVRRRCAARVAAAASRWTARRSRPARPCSWSPWGRARRSAAARRCCPTPSRTTAWPTWCWCTPSGRSPASATPWTCATGSTSSATTCTGCAGGWCGSAVPAASRTNADGEVSGPWTERTWTVRPAAWALVVPPGRPAVP